MEWIRSSCVILRFAPEERGAAQRNLGRVLLMNIDDQVSNKVLISFLGQITNQVRYEVRYQVWNQVDDQVENQVWGQVRANVRDQVRNPQ